MYDPLDQLFVQYFCVNHLYMYLGVYRKTIIESIIIPPPQTVFVGGYTVFTLSVRPFVRNVLFP